MATKNLIPRGSGEGGIGITGTSWGSGVFNSGIFNDSLTVGGEQVALSSELSNYTTSDDLSECINYTVGLTGHIIPDTNAAYDLGNAEYKIRHLFLSDNSLHIGGTTISAGDTLGEIQFPSGITVTKNSIFNGDVGIGVTNPNYKLHVDGDIRISNQDKLYIGNEFNYLTSNSSNDLNISANRNITFSSWIAGVEQNNVNISENGNVGIGTETPAHKLEVNSGALCIKSSGPMLILKDEDGGDVNSQNGYVSFRDNSDTERGYVGFGSVVNKNLTVSNNIGDIILHGGDVGIGTSTPGAKLDVDGAMHLSGVAMTPDEEGRINFGPSGIMVGQAAVKPDPDNPESLFFQAIPQVKDTEGNAVTVLTADKLGLGTADVLTGIEDDLKFKLLTDQQRFVVGTTGDYGLESGWYRFNDFKIKGATDIGAHPINPVDTRIYSDESSFVLFKTDTAGNRVAHLVGGDEEVSPNNAIALGIAVKVDNTESPQDIEFVHTDGESYSVINGNSDSLGTNGLPIRQGFQNASVGSNPSHLLIDGGSF